MITRPFPDGWCALLNAPEIQRFIESGLVLSVHYNGVMYTGRVADMDGRIPALTLPLHARSFWTAAIIMNALYQEAWKNHVIAMESV